MDPASKIRKFFGRPVESDKETSGKESGQTKSLEKKHRSDSVDHIQTAVKSESIKNIKDQDIGINVFGYSRIPTIFHEVRQIGSENDLTQTDYREQVAEANSQTASIEPAKSMIPTPSPPKKPGSGNQIPSSLRDIPKTAAQASVHKSVPSDGNTYVEPDTSIKDLSGFRCDYSDYVDNYCAVSQAGKDLAEKFNLTPEEVGAIRIYSGPTYKHINWQMRNLPDPSVNLYDAKALEQSGVRNDMVELIANLTNGLRKLPPAQSSFTDFKGLGRDANLPADELAKYKQGAIISTPMFTSTTTELGQLTDMDWWTKFPHTIIVHQRPNGNGRNIGPFSTIPRESEIIFLPNTRFGVNSVKENIKVGGPVNWFHLSQQTESEINAAFNQPMDEDLIKTVIALQELPPEDKPKEKLTSFRSSIKNF